MHVHNKCVMWYFKCNIPNVSDFWRVQPCQYMHWVHVKYSTFKVHHYPVQCIYSPLLVCITIYNPVHIYRTLAVCIQITLCICSPLPIYADYIDRIQITRYAIQYLYINSNLTYLYALSIYSTLAVYQKGRPN